MLYKLIMLPGLFYMQLSFLSRN